VTEFQKPLQEETNAIHRLRRLRMHLEEERNGGNVQLQVPVLSGI